MKIILGLTGSVATTLAKKILKHLQSRGHEVKVVMTEKADHFVKRSYNTPDLDCEVLENGDEFPYGVEWTYEDGDPVPHKELADWADGLLIAPCSANTLSKIATGQADGLLTTIARIWNPDKPFCIAPAMNTQMLKNHPTWLNLSWLDPRIKVLWPSVRLLACGEYGCGSLCDIAILGPVMEGYRWETPMEITLHTSDWMTHKVPTLGHPGGFGYARKHYVHPGVDLYNPNRMFNPHGAIAVKAMAGGLVVAIDTFTGAHDTPPSPWWEDTWHVTIYDPVLDLNILYGEIRPWKDLKVGDQVQTGDTIGYIKPVLKNTPKNPPRFHHRDMLHVELMTPDHVYTEPWHEGEPRPKHMLDPTALLALMPKTDLVAGYQGEIG